MCKNILVMLGMMLAVCGAYAQENGAEYSESVDTLNVNQENSPGTVVSSADIQQLISLLNQTGESTGEGNVYIIDQTTSIPIVGKNRFARSHYIYQTVEISTLAGTDKDSDDSADDNSGKDGLGGGVPSVISGLNIGMNIGYRLIFVPGRINGDMLEVNRFGFAYSTGILAAFDRQEKYGVTCDFLLKLGVEVGNGHALGIGVDALWGGGKSSGYFYFTPVQDEEDDPECFYYTDWCMKYGGQIWIKTNLLTTSIRNTDILAFARFVRSVNPVNDNDLVGISNVWNEESWQFGVTLRYRF